MTSLLSVVAVFWLTISHTSKVLNEKVMDSSYSTLKETGLHLNDILNNVNEELLSLSANKTLQKDLLSALQSQNDSAKAIVDLRDLTLYAKNFNSNYSTVEIYGFNSFLPSTLTSDDVMSVEAIQKKPWYSKTLAQHGKTWWHINYDFGYPQLTGSRVVMNYRNIPNLLAVISLDIELDKFSRILSNIKLLESGRIYMTTDDGSILCPTDSSPKKIPRLPPTGKKYIYDSKTKEFLIAQKLSPVNLWLVGLVPKGELTKDSSDYTYYILMIAVLVFLLSLFMAFFLSRRVSKPVITLANAMKAVEKGDFSIQVHTTQRDEIASLYSNFNFMVSKINTLIHEVYETRLKKKDAELKALQAQINPHFLYNTLNSISWLSIKYNAEEINRAIASLSSILRYNLNIDLYSTTLKEELEHIRHYCYLQQMRYGDKFKIQYDVDEKLLRHRILKFLIQPIVENALKHGLTDDVLTTIMLRICLKDDTMLIQVSNDGNPIDLAKTNLLLENEDAESPHHGIRNVNERLKLYYNDNPGLQFDLVDSITYVRIHIPAELYVPVQEKKLV